MSRFLAWWNTRVTARGPGSLLLRFAIGLAVSLILWLVLAIAAQSIISSR